MSHELLLLLILIVRVLPDGSGRWSLARFEADNALRDPPLRVLPSLLREVAEAKGSDGQVLRISGEISRYKGRRYLLLRKVLKERQMGQF